MKKSKIKNIIKIIISFLLLQFFCVRIIFAYDNTYLKIKATTYFGDEWPTTYWSREYKNESFIFDRIKNDGFNTIILCIPWREIQPDLVDGFNEVAIDKINYIIDLADKKGLKVMVRLGYTWDYYDNESSINRFKLIWTNDNVRKAWIRYAKKMNDVLFAHPNFSGAFITWEDFWDGLCESFSTYDKIDNALLELLTDTQEVFLNLSMECRLHEDFLQNGSLYSHKDTFSCGSSTFSSLLLTVSMGHPYYKTLNVNDAVRMSSTLIDKFALSTNNKPIFIDQFLYTESTPGYEFLSKVDNINVYLEKMGDVFDKKTIGYGLWTYQDYIDNVIYNSEFALDDKNWDFIGNVKVVTKDDNKMAYMDAGTSIRQDISWKGFLAKDALNFNMRVVSDIETDMEVVLADQKKPVHIVPGENIILLTFENKSKDLFEIKTSGKVYVDDIKLYSHVITGGMYGIDGREGSNILGLRILNSKIK